MYIFRKTYTLRPQDVLVHTGSIALATGGNFSYVYIFHIHKGYNVDTNVDDIAIIKVGIPKFYFVFIENND